MLDLGSSEFYLAVRGLPAPELEGLSTQIFDDWETFIDHSLALQDYSLSLQVEEVSIKGVGSSVRNKLQGRQRYCLVRSHQQLPASSQIWEQHSETVLYFPNK